VEAIFSFFWPDGFVTLDATGLPDKFVECPFFQTILRFWKACFEWSEASDQDKSLFRQFLEGKVISWQETDWTISLFVKICTWLPLKEQGWYSLRCLVLFLNQHGRLSQPWGAYIQRWLECQMVKARVPVPEAILLLEAAPAA
jgi:hypothetical protein